MLTRVEAEETTGILIPDANSCKQEFPCPAPAAGGRGRVPAARRTSPGRGSVPDPHRVRQLDLALFRHRQIEADPVGGFLLERVARLRDRPVAGQSVPAHGDFHGVTRRVELPVQGQYLDGQVVVVGSTVILLADYEIDAPRAASVLGVSEAATIELQLVFRKA